MSETLLDAIGVLTSIQRWNLMPRVEVWSEAENIAYYTHLAYGISKLMNLDKEAISSILFRCLLKSFNKHYLSDIVVSTRESIKEIEYHAWEKIVDEAADISARLFPREIQKLVYGFMDYEGSYQSTEKEISEDIILFCQYESAKEECKINKSIYKTPQYDDKLAEIEKKTQGLKSKKSRYEEIYSWYNDSKFKKYINLIRQTKFVRRWNRINRTIESTVLAHTFVVSILAIIFSTLYKFDNGEKDDDLIYGSVLKALFHDIPESLTGDIITPVKSIIDNHVKIKWNGIEKLIIKKNFLAIAPTNIREDIEKYRVLADIGNPELFSFHSLVKECDRLALVMECLFERKAGKIGDEMSRAYEKYIALLQNSEWPRIREFTSQLLFDYPK